MKEWYANLILPLSLPKLYTYHIPEPLVPFIQNGMRVVIQFGAKRYYAAIVHAVHNNPPEIYQTKNILSVLDEIPLVNEIQFTFWQWLADYYMCTLGEVMKAALPSGLKMESETNIWISGEVADDTELTIDEESLLNFIEKGKITTIRELTTKYGKNPLPLLKTLIDKGMVVTEEQLKDKYKEKTEIYVSIHSDYQSDDRLHEMLDKLQRATKQLQIVMLYLSKTGFHGSKQPIAIKRKELVEPKDYPHINSLIKKGILEVENRVISRLAGVNQDISPMKTLSPSQLNSYTHIKECFSSKKVVLFKGVTSSGKTEIYIKLIDEALKEGKQVLYLLPEIALTVQIIARLRKIFGDRIAVYHSKYSDNERVEVWKKLVQDGLTKKPTLVVGVRSSILLPFSNLGLVIVDEEHENSFKQYDPAPRYNARDAVIYLASLQGAKVLLGTATPSFESFANANSGKYGFVQLNERFAGIEMPVIEVVDLKRSQKRKEMKALLSKELFETMQDAFNNQEQVILFQNRRGFSSWLECNICGWVPHCKNCDVSLTYHKNIHQLVCHYCGFTHQVVQECIACGHPGMKTVGHGTERIEEDLTILFPEIKMARLDLDAARSRKSYETLIDSFEEGNIQLLIGTQMITKGLDFSRVSVVGILNADNLLNYPDFRSYERAYQLMTQVSGRAGRKFKRGKVIIQTSQPTNNVIKNVVQGNYEAIYKQQMEERDLFRYPPYYRIIDFTVKHKNHETVEKGAELFTQLLKSKFGSRVLGPEAPFVSRIQSYYILKVMLKLEKSGSFEKAKIIVQEITTSILSKPALKSLVIVADVDPM